MIGKPIYGKGFKGLAAYLAKGALPTKERAQDERIVEECLLALCGGAGMGEVAVRSP